MGLRKLLSPENAFQVLCSNRRVVSGLGAGVLASLLIFSLLFSAGGNSGGAATVASSPSSLLSWFFSAPGDGSGAAGREVQAPSSGKVAVSEGETDVEGNAQGGPLEKARVSENTHLEDLIGNATQGGSSALKQRGDLASSIDGNITGTGNGTVSVKGGVFVKPSEVWNPRGEELASKETHATNLSIHDGNTSFAIVATSEEKGNVTDFLNGRGNENLNNTGESEERHGVADGDQRPGPRKCDIFRGRWVGDESKPYYPPRSCPLIDESFDCHMNGRPDYEFLRWRWQPDDCDIPSFDATDFLRRLRGQRIIFVGDSLNRNMWESLVCILRHSIKNKKNVYERSGRTQFKTEGYYSFVFKDYNCSVDFVRSTFLVKEYITKVNGSEDEKLRLDLMDATTSAYHEADIVVFNTGHWWTHEKTSRGIDYYQEGDHVFPLLKVLEAYRRALLTWAKWVDQNINHNKTQVVFRGYSLTHFRGGQWNSGGQCHKEMEPIFNESFIGKYPAKMRALDQVLKQMKTPVIYLNISRLTDYRKDGHPSIYRKKYASVEEQINAERTQDCSHWCLPGVPDTWNELLYASLLMAGRGPWKK